MSAIVVRGLGPVWGTPSPSPFVIKVLTWMRMAGIEHELVPLRSPPRSATRKIPYVELPGGEIVSDSSRIIARLSRDRGIDLDAGLDGRARATARLLESTFAGHLYFAVLYERFATPEGFAHTRRDYFAREPWLVRTLLPFFVRRQRTSSPTSPACARRTGGEWCRERRRAADEHHLLPRSPTPFPSPLAGSSRWGADHASTPLIFVLVQLGSARSDR